MPKTPKVRVETEVLSAERVELVRVEASVRLREYPDRRIIQYWSLAESGNPSKLLFQEFAEATPGGSA